MNKHFKIKEVGRVIIPLNVNGLLHPTRSFWRIWTSKWIISCSVISLVAQCFIEAAQPYASCQQFTATANRATWRSSYQGSLHGAPESFLFWNLKAKLEADACLGCQLPTFTGDIKVCDRNFAKKVIVVPDFVLCGVIKKSWGVKFEKARVCSGVLSEVITVDRPLQDPKTQTDKLKNK